MIDHSPQSPDAGEPAPLSDWSDVVGDALHRAVAVVVISWAAAAAVVYAWVALHG